MSALSVVVPEVSLHQKTAPRGKVAMCCLITAEAAIFSIFVVAYLFYEGKSLSGPTPADVLTVPVFITICLLSSSLTIHFAARSLRNGQIAVFARWWFLTMMLGAIFLGGTAREWSHLIYDKGLTIQTNLFGTTYYALVGLHAFHVTVGLLGLLVVLLFAVRGHVRQQHFERIDVLSLYWHFVDAVWVVVFLVVYVIGR
jgi:cytochrome c oxidase subunit 3/cytochrome o ubiquinol oxidase subunit 3